ncbi:hypothetical protein LCGC14_1864240, partial [marine sediment metagenome]
MATVNFFIGGTATGSKNIWKMQDDGTDITILYSALTAAGEIVRALVKDIDGNLYVGTSNGKVYKYTDSGSALSLDTSWATAGIYTVAASNEVHALSVDINKFLAIAHTKSGTEHCALLNASGAEQWDADTGSNSNTCEAAA